MAASYTYEAGPTLTSIAPTAGTINGGTAVTLTGTVFKAGATITFGGVSATSIVIVNATTATCVTPAHSAAAVDVVITNTGDGQSSTLPASYTYQPAPTFTSISPNVGVIGGGTNVTITGTGFVSGATVTVGGNSCGTLTVVSGTSITCTTAAHAVGATNVVVTNTDTQTVTGTNAFTFQGPPTVTAIAPIGGITTGGTNVTLTGTNFRSGMTVAIGAITCTSPVVVSGTSATCTTGNYGSTATVNVVATDSDTQSGTLTNGYTYEPPPAVTSLSLTLGAAGGANNLTITGTGFLTGATVTFGGVAATAIVIVNATTITCTTPAHAAGAVNVVVTNLDMQTGTLTSGFTYSSFNTPTLTSVAPGGGPLGVEHPLRSSGPISTWVPWLQLGEVAAPASFSPAALKSLVPPPRGARVSRRWS